MPFGFTAALIGGASLEAAAAVITVTGAFEVAAAVGAVLSVVGIVTKDKALMTAGLVIGAIGGIGGLASSAGLLGADAAAGTSLFGASPAASTADVAADSGADSAGLAVMTGDAGEPLEPAAVSGAAGGAVGPGSDTIDYVSQMASGEAVDPLNATPGAAGTPGSVDMAANPANASDQFEGATTSDNAATSTAGTEATTGVTPATSPNPMPAPLQSGADTTAAQAQVDQVPVPPAPPGGVGTYVNGQNVAIGVDPTTGKLVDAGDTSNVFGKLVDYVGNHPVVGLGVLQAGGTLLSGALSSLTPAQVNLANAQAANNNAAAALTTQQTANLAMPKATVSSTPVTGTPQTLVPGAGTSASPTTPSTPQFATAGLINQPQQVPLTSVSGVPA